MNNNLFMNLIRNVLKRGFAEQGINNIRVMQNFQGKKTNSPDTPTVAVHRIDDRPVHWQSRKAVSDGDDKLIREEQSWITTFQFNAFVPRVEPELETMDDVSSEDLLRIARMILQGQRMLDTCKQAGFGLLPAATTSPNWVQDEHDNWVNEPSFNLEIATKQRLDWKVPTLVMGDVYIKRV